MLATSDLQFDLKRNWNMRIYGIQDPSKMEELSSLKLVVAFILDVSYFDTINCAACSVVIIYFAAVCVRKNACHLHKALLDAEKYCVISSNTVNIKYLNKFFKRLILLNEEVRNLICTLHIC